MLPKIYVLVFYRPDGCNICKPSWYLDNVPVDCETGSKYCPCATITSTIVWADAKHSLILSSSGTTLKSVAFSDYFASIYSSMYSNVNKDTLYSVELPLFWFYFVFEKIFKV